MENARICPQCGDVISSFMGKCQSCGTEFRNIESSKSVTDFSNNISQAMNFEQKIEMIKTFPIPNTKEDILEFMILASSNIGYSENQDSSSLAYEEAWIAKFIQGNQKAKIILANDRDYDKVQKLFSETMCRLDEVETERNRKKLIKLVLKNLGVAAGIITAILAVWMDFTRKNSSMMELLSVIIIIASAGTLKKRNAEYLDYGLAAIGGLVLIVLSFMLGNGAVFELGGAIALIVVAVNFFKRKS